MIIIPRKAKYYLSENNQKWNIKIALGEYNKQESTVECIHPFIMCRDYYNDMILYHTFPNFVADKLKGTIHGFSSSEDLKEDFNPMEKDYVLVIQRNSMEHDIDIYELNCLEYVLNLKPTRIVYADEKYYVLSFDKKWLYNNFSFAAYTLLVRISCHLQGYSNYDMSPTFIDYFYSVRRYPQLPNTKNIITDDIINAYTNPVDFLETVANSLRINYWENKNSEVVWKMYVNVLYNKMDSEYQEDYNIDEFEGNIDKYVLHDGGIKRANLEDFC